MARSKNDVFIKIQATAYNWKLYLPIKNYHTTNFGGLNRFLY